MGGATRDYYSYFHGATRQVALDFELGLAPTRNEKEIRGNGEEPICSRVLGLVCPQFRSFSQMLLQNRLIPRLAFYRDIICPSILGFWKSTNRLHVQVQTHWSTNLFYMDPLNQASRQHGQALLLSLFQSRGSIQCNCTHNVSITQIERDTDRILGLRNPLIIITFRFRCTYFCQFLAFGRVFIGTSNQRGKCALGNFYGVQNEINGIHRFPSFSCGSISGKQIALP